MHTLCIWITASYIVGKEADAQNNGAIAFYVVNPPFIAL